MNHLLVKVNCSFPCTTVIGRIQHKLSFLNSLLTYSHAKTRLFRRSIAMPIIFHMLCVCYIACFFFILFQFQSSDIFDVFGGKEKNYIAHRYCCQKPLHLIIYIYNIY